METVDNLLAPHEENLKVTGNLSSQRVSDV